MFRTIVTRLNRTLIYVASVAICSLALLVVLNVILRYLGYPIRGDIEVAELLFMMSGVLAIAHTQQVGAHIAVDILFNQFSPRVQRTILVANKLIGILVAGLIAVAAWRFALDSLRWNEQTDFLRIAIFPFKFLIVLAGITWALTYLSELLDGESRPEVKQVPPE